MTARCEGRFFASIRVGTWRRLLPLLLLLSSSAWAWNGAGHRLVACLAWNQLDTYTRSEVARVLHEHPDYTRWIKRTDTADVDRIAFIEASTWPDDIRKDSRFYTAGVDAATPVLTGFPDMERHQDWHYVNRPFGVTRPKTTPEAAISGRLDQQLVTLAAILDSPNSLASEKAYALPWLIHLVGDAHQPLHASIRLDADGRPDSLGKGVSVSNPFNSRRPSSTLHAFWDDLPGPSWLRGERLNAACAVLATAYPHPVPTSPERWIDESWQIAKDSAYPPGTEATPTISEAFYNQSRAIADQRVSEAGYRLADWLHEIMRRR